MTLGGQTLVQVSGTIDGCATRDNVVLRAKADSDAWSMDVKATYPNGETVNDQVFFTQQLAAATPATGALGGSLSGRSRRRRRP